LAPGERYRHTAHVALPELPPAGRSQEVAITLHVPQRPDADRTVYMADARNDRVQQFTIGGAYLAQWGTHGGGDGQFNRPTGVGCIV